MGRRQRPKRQGRRYQWQNRTVPPWCPTAGKRIYTSEAKADRAVDALAVHARRSGRKVPKRSYPCGDHWHITAVPLDAYQQEESTDG